VKVARALDARVELALVPKDAPKRQQAVPARVPRRRERKREFVAAERSSRASRSDFIASDKPAKPQSRKP
jgi:uncharacterized protein (DUF2384 family)